VIQTISGETVAGFSANAWRPFVISCKQNQEMAVWKTTFMPEHLITDLFQLTTHFSLAACFACCSLGDSSWQLGPGKQCKERKTHNGLPLSCVLSNMHTFALTQMRKFVFKSPSFKELLWFLARKLHTFVYIEFFPQVKTSHIFYIAFYTLLIMYCCSKQC